MEIITIVSQEMKCNGKCDDETLPIIHKSKHPKSGNTRNKKEGPMSKKI
jgi:hypothetical protein